MSHHPYPSRQGGKATNRLKPSDNVSRLARRCPSREGKTHLVLGSTRRQKIPIRMPNLDALAMEYQRMFSLAKTAFAEAVRADAVARAPHPPPPGVCSVSTVPDGQFPLHFPGRFSEFAAGSARVLKPQEPFPPP